MIQLQMSRQTAISTLAISARTNCLLTNDEAECGAVTTDELDAEDDDGQVDNSKFNNIFFATNELLTPCEDLYKYSLIFQSLIDQVYWQESIDSATEKEIQGLLSVNVVSAHFAALVACIGSESFQFQNRFATLSIIEEENNETSMVVSLKENLSHNSNLIRCFQNNQNQEEEKIGCLSNQIQNQDQSNVKSTQSKKRKFDCIEAQEEKSNNKRFKLNNDPADILVQNHLIAQEVKQNAKRNQEEIILLKVKQEVEEFKRQYQNWKRFYERNVKHKKTYIQVITQDKLEYQHRARPRTPTKIKQFQLNVDIRMNQNRTVILTEEDRTPQSHSHSHYKMKSIIARDSQDLLVAISNFMISKTQTKGCLFKAKGSLKMIIRFSLKQEKCLILDLCQTLFLY
eukprot:403371129